jgi:hypothetical protein
METRARIGKLRLRGNVPCDASARQQGSLVLFFTWNIVERVDAPGECPPPFGIHSRDVHAALLPFFFPNSAAIDRRAMHVRAFQRVEFRACKVQWRSELIRRRERVEVRRMDEGVVAAERARERYLWLAFSFFSLWNAIQREGEKHKGSLHIFGFAIQ